LVANGTYDPATDAPAFPAHPDPAAGALFPYAQDDKGQPLKLARLWIRPVIILIAAGLVVFLPQPGHHAVRHFLTQDWAWLGLAAGLGGVAGWYWGRTMTIEVHPEDGTLMVKAARPPSW